MYSLYLNYPFISKGLAVSFLSAAAVEEGLKFLVLYFVVYRLREFNEPMDAIVYGVCASLGFEALENIYYVSNASTLDVNPIRMLIERSIYPLAAHGIFGVIMGYFFMKYDLVHKLNKLSLILF